MLSRFIMRQNFDVDISLFHGKLQTISHNYNAPPVCYNEIERNQDEDIIPHKPAKAVFKLS